MYEWLIQDDDSQNGAMMRIAPLVSLLVQNNNQKFRSGDVTELLVWACADTLLTHRHDLTVALTAFFTVAVATIILTGDRVQMEKNMKKMLDAIKVASSCSLLALPQQ